MVLDLRDQNAAAQAFEVEGGFDDVYGLAADMGGMGFIPLPPPPPPRKDRFRDRPLGTHASAAVGGVCRPRLHCRLDAL